MANYVRGEITVFPRPVSVVSVDVEYCLGASSTVAPSSADPGWQTTVPTVTAEKPYIWSRTATVQSNSNVPMYSVPMCITSESGETVVNIQEEYYLSTSSQEPTGSIEGWVSTAPEWEEDHYIWTRSIITYSDQTSINTDPVLATTINRTEERQATLQTAVTDAQSSIREIRIVVDDNESRLNRISARVVIDQNEIGFYDSDGNKVAYINGNEFHFAQGFIDLSLQVGNYVIRNDGSGGFAIV